MMCGSPSIVDMPCLVPGKRYALTLQVMLKKRERKRKATNATAPPPPPPTRPPKIARESRPAPVPLETPGVMAAPNPRVMEEFSPTYEDSFPNPDPPAVHPSHLPIQMTHHHHHHHSTDAEHIWRGFEMTSTAQLPVWLSDESLGGNSFSQNGMDAFLLPPDYLPPPPRVW